MKARLLAALAVLISNTGCGQAVNLVYNSSRDAGVDFTLLLNSGATHTASLPVTLTFGSLEGDPTEAAVFSGAGCVGTETWLPISNSFSITVAAGDGTKTLSAKTRSTLFTSDCKDASIVLDQTAPTSLSMTKPGGTAPTNLTTVSLTASASDTSTPLDVYVTSTAGCGSGGTWQAAASAVSFALPAPTTAFAGTKSVYYKVRDKAGNESTCAQYDITLDTIVPTVTVSAPAQAAIANAASLALSGTCSENGTANVTIAASSTGGGSFTSVTADCSGNTWSKTVSVTGLSDGTITFTASTSDTAGNSGSSTTTTASDQTAPTGTMTINSGDADTTALSAAINFTASSDTAQSSIFEGTCPGTGPFTYSAYSEFANLQMAAFGSSSTVSETRNVAAILKDAFGNTVCVSDSIVLYNARNFVSVRGNGFRVLDSAGTVNIPVYLRDFNGAALVPGTGVDVEYTLEDQGAMTKGSVTIASADADGQENISVPIPDVATERVMKLTLNHTGSKSVPLHSSTHVNISVVDSAASNTPIGVVASGGFHSCIIKGASALSATGSSGKLWCWGDNSNRQTDGTSSDRLSPVAIDSTVDYMDVSAGTYHTCAITSAGAMKCWGANDKGQLGKGGSVDATAPAGLHTVTHPTAGTWTFVAAGGNHTCAVDNAGKIYCWGDDSSGQIGNGATTGVQTSPVEVSAANVANNYTQVSSGTGHSCAIAADKFLYCWGLNGNGQSNPTAVGSNVTVPTKVTVPGVDSATNPDLKFNTTHRIWDRERRVAAGGAHTCAIASASAVDNADANDRSRLFCWGKNDAGQTAAAGTGNTLTPTRVISSSMFSVGAGVDNTCTLVYNASITARLMRCFGGNSDGKLGNGATSDASIFIVDRDSKATTTQTVSYNSVAPGDDHTCAVATSTWVTSDDASPVAQYSVRCTGDNQQGQLAQGSVQDVATPSVVDGFTAGSGGPRQFSAVSMGERSGCAIDTSGSLFCWGSHSRKTVGDAVTSSTGSPGSFQRSGPVKIDHGTAYSSVSVGDENACAITQSGSKLKCWGENSDGHVGVGNEDLIAPTSISATQTYTQVSTGGANICAIKTGGGLQCWGVNGSGQVGIGTTSLQKTPANIDSSVTYAKVSVGYNHTCALTSAGKIKCWGEGGRGQLGTGTTADSYTPVAVDAANDYVDISAGTENTCAIRKSTSSTGTVFCWGENTWGQVGNNTMGADVLAPAQIKDAGGTVIGDLYSSVSTGQYLTCAIRSADGKVLCWGHNTSGQLGDGTFVDKINPNLSLITQATKLTAARNTACAIEAADQTLKCWGYDDLANTGLRRKHLFFQFVPGL